MSEGLAWYLSDAASLLRDTGFQFTSQARLTRWINVGRQQVAKHTGCIRALIPGTAPFGSDAGPGSALPGSAAPGVALDSGFMARVGVERYAYGFATPYLQRANSGARAVNDVFSIAVNWNGFRPTMRWMPWDELQAYCRAYANLVTSWPLVWSNFGSGTSGQAWLWPAPSQDVEMEWDCTCLPVDLASNNDFDALPDSFHGAVKYYAAGMAFLGSYRYGMADQMFALFLQHLGVDLFAAEGGKVPDYYWTALATR